ncbi:protein kinase C-binding protein NELL2-like [Stylophora pistillata]|uniref:protein kinase C-binding protein NELL2-like n=1 Tax=Stylophora pistillata TaxID=50429 RepID=UPI000C04AFB7|nr:protein kinase C-binding protein NELL2-like [Stylophora pistillata]
MSFHLNCLLVGLCSVIIRTVCSQGSADMKNNNNTYLAPSVNSRDGLLSLDKFHYLDVPPIDIIIVYDDFECIFECLNHPLCMSVNLATEEQLRCQLLSSHKENNTKKLYQNKSSDHYYFAKLPCSSKRCQNRGTCLHTKRNYKLFECLCEHGFSGEHCEKDIDECSKGGHTCDVNANCQNTNGSYNCSCKKGYTGDGRSCSDIDECVTEKDECGTDAVCNNTEGSYNCTCRTGYSGDGRTCKGSF